MSNKVECIQHSRAEKRWQYRHVRPDEWGHRGRYIYLYLRVLWVWPRDYLNGGDGIYVRNRTTRLREETTHEVFEKGSNSRRTIPLGVRGSVSHIVISHVPLMLE